MKRRKPRPYWCLLTRETPSDKWGMAFGDHDRSIVAFERTDYRQSYTAKNLAIISAESARAKSVQAAIDALNQKAA